MEHRDPATMHQQLQFWATFGVGLATGLSVAFVKILVYNSRAREDETFWRKMLSSINDEMLRLRRQLDERRGDVRRLRSELDRLTRENERLTIELSKQPEKQWSYEMLMS
jgi:predicted nuclease with TOPRIM domain